MLSLAILACAGGFGLLVYRYDMYEREPWYMLLLVVALGAGAYWGLSYGEDVILERLAGGGTSLLAIAAVAGILEELAKLLVVLAVWLAIPRHFNDPFDGLVYGAMAGLGFALGESAFYMGLVGAELSWFPAAAQEAVRLFLHLLTGALTCVGVGLARFRVTGWPYLLGGFLSTSMLIHFGWDYFCGLSFPEESGVLQQRIMAVALMVATLVLFGLAACIAMKHSSDAHPIHPLKNLWGWPFSRFARGR
jgi:RsiW-degrading membrane proteinase PrsW (M82 family)